MKTNSLEAALRDVENTIGLQWLTDAGHPCTAAFMSEIIVCFVDLRGFTDYQLTVDLHPQDSSKKFIEDYYRLSYKAVSKALWVWRTRDQNIFIREDPRIPKRHKYLGDGMMLVWEPKDSAPDPLAFGLDVVGFMQGYFAQMMDPSKRKSYPANVQDLELGIGIASGKAWQLTFGPGLPQDYVGSTVNLAARMQARADPKGVVVATRGNPQPLEILETQDKVIREEPSASGSGNKEITSWRSSSRYLRMPPVLSDIRTKPPRWMGLWLHELLPLVPDEFLLMTSDRQIDISVPSENDDGYADRMLDLRRAIEVFTVRAAAREAARSEDPTVALRVTIDTMKALASKKPLDPDGKEQCIEAGEDFHWEIAKLAGFKTAETRELLDILMTPTGPSYENSSKHLPQIIEEHKAIMRAIASGDEDEAEEAMRIHLYAQPVRMRA